MSREDIRYKSNRCERTKGMEGRYSISTRNVGTMRTLKPRRSSEREERGGREMFGTWRREIHYAARDERSGKERFIRRDNNEMNVAVVASSSRLRFRAFSRIPDRKSRHKSANILLSLAAGRHRRRAETARAVRGN